MILTPRYLAGVADGVVDIFSQAENEILADIARRIVKTGGVSNTAGWQLQKMREAGMLNEDTVKQLAAATNKSEAEIQRMLKESYKRALSFDIDVIPADLKMSWTQIKDNPAFRAIMLQGVNNANQLVSNFTKTTAGAAQTAFFNALDVSYLQHITGAQTREEAVRGALKKLAQQGIYKVAYPQDNGGIFYNSVEAAVRRALTTAVNQSCAKLQLANCDMLGTDLVETTAHLGARPSHAVWQGKIFSRSGSTKKYPDFVKSTGYGTGDGLCGWNCRHSFFPYFEGYSTPAYDMSKFDSEENARLYEEEQKQRRYERMVREAKREVSTLEAGLDAAESAELQEGLAADLRQAKQKLRNRQKLLREYCEDHDLFNDYSRTYTPGYNGRNRTRIVSAKTPKMLDNPAKSGIMETGAISGALSPYSKAAERHAVQYYESVRHMTSDAARIAQNTQISADKIEKIKKHVFLDEHDLIDGRHRFVPSYDMAQSWQRLISGKYEEKDIILLKHEYAELRYMERGLSQNEAHIRASKRYNYAMYCG